MSALPFDNLPQPQKTDPRTKRCAQCRSPLAHCENAGQWYCPGCVHPSYWPKNRGQG